MIFARRDLLKYEVAIVVRDGVQYPTARLLDQHNVCLRNHRAGPVFDDSSYVRHARLEYGRNWLHLRGQWESSPRHRNSDRRVQGFMRLLSRPHRAGIVGGNSLWLERRVVV